jgi:hypothetical protein
MRTTYPLSPLARVACLVLVLAAGVGPGPAGATSLGQANCRRFQQTGRDVCDRFLEYWTQNGELAQQGYPISATMQERSDTDGKTYTVQYFERAVFEAHPENRRPYDVLLSLLGVFEYNRRYGRSIAPGQRAGADNPLLFRETGKTLAGRFRAYWERNGGLAQQGFPITDEFEERSVLDGKTYKVQYFQRAVFELHPENAAPNDVLLSHLGRFRYDQKYGAQATPRPAASPTAASGQLRPGQGRWITRASIPTPRSEVAVAEVNGKIYVLGGFAASTQDVHEEYDPATDRWRTRAALPRPLNHAAAAGLNGKLYLIGGFDGPTGRAVAEVYEYDPASDKWRPLAPMPTPRGALGVAVIDGKIYAVGGRDAGDVDANEVYDPARDAWARLAAMPTARDHLAVAALGGKVYAMGGRFDTFTRNTGVNEVFDPATGRWQTRAPMPTPRSGIAAAVLSGHVLVFGGEASEGTFEENEAYNPATDSWTALAPMPTPRHGIGAAVVGNIVYIPSGGPTPGGSQTPTHEAFTLSSP